VFTGASLTGLMAMLAVAVAVLNAVIPPLLVVSAVPPAEPLVWSHARNVMPLTVPLKSALGTKRTRVLASAASRRALAAVGLPNGDQLEPPLVEYCHVPSLSCDAE
jgi:hypothetical protein